VLDEGVDFVAVSSVGTLGNVEMLSVRTTVAPGFKANHSVVDTEFLKIGP